MSDEGIQKRLARIVLAVAGRGPASGEIDPSTPLRDGGLWLDSVRLLELIVAVEAEFEVDFDPVTDFGEAALATVGSLSAVIERRLGAR
jgi:acyl carrier protein